jgi:hypothetical protein
VNHNTICRVSTSTSSQYARPLPKPLPMEPFTVPFFEMTRTKLLFFCYLSAI